ncbi:armadillo repeat-containing protein 6-like [Argonauta hians]
MSKVISQETFDDVVVENIEEFEMTPEEALEDALSQFKTQDVNLSLVVKDSEVYSTENNGPIVHTCVKIINQLKQFVADNDDGSSLNEILLEKLVSELVEECSDFAKSSLAGVNGSYTTLFQLLPKLRNCQNNGLLAKYLSAINVVLVGQSKLMKTADTKYFLEMLDQYRSDVTVLVEIVYVIGTSCITNEANRKSYITGHVVSKVMDLLQCHKDEKELVKAICALFCVLMADDDSSVPFGNAHETCRLIATEDSGLMLILELCKYYRKDSTILKDLLTTLPLLLVRNEFCHQVYKGDGIPFLSSILLEYFDNPTICLKTLTTLQCMARNDEVKEAIVKQEALELILAPLSHHSSKPAVCDAVVSLVGALALRSPSNAEAIMKTEFPRLLVQVMKLYPDSARLQKSACIAVRNVVYHKTAYTDTFLQLDIEQLVNDVLKRHSSVINEAKAALRDLGCKVELTEQWKGVRGSIPH